jgi:hypothetical protein
MVTVGLLVVLEAKAGKDDELARWIPGIACVAPPPHAARSGW